ncbi:MAG TPA: HD domain-containing phosphohydrolase [Bacillota bacterium]
MITSITSTKISLIELASCLSNVLDLISPLFMNHHKRVAYIAFRIADELKLPQAESNLIVLAALLHDIGLLSLQDRLDTLNFEMDFKSKNLLLHGLLGQHLLENYIHATKVPLLVGAHHLYWQDRKDCSLDERTLLGSQIIHLADRTDILIDRSQEILGQVPGILAQITAYSGTMFCPELVKVLSRLAVKEYFWLDLVSPHHTWLIETNLAHQTIELDSYDLLSLAKTFCYIIDFRSSFLANHSAGVAASSQALADLMNFPPQESLKIKIAGYLHDLGKLAIPREILEKPGKLNHFEYNIMKSHAYYGYRTLETVHGFEKINAWGTLHHERLNGQGYPFHIGANELTLGSRIVAVADIFTALLEDRPYRKGMSEEKALQIIQNYTEDGALDPDVVAVLKANINVIHRAQSEAQKEATLDYQKFRAFQE